MPGETHAHREDPLSGLIYAAIVAMWAAVLVPMWLRRHDASVEARSVDRFSTAMRILSRRSAATTSKRYVVMPRRLPDSMSWHVSGASVPSSASASPAGPARTSARAPVTRRPGDARRALIARRRRVMLSLTAFAAFTLLLVVVGLVPWPVQALVDLLLVAYVTHLRIEAKNAARLRSRGVRGGSRSAPVRPRPVAPAAAYAAVPVQTPAEPVVVEAVEAAVEVPATEPRHHDEDISATGTDGWQPVPVPPPTYTLKPPAPSPSYVVDLTRPGHWSESQLIEDDALDPGAWEDDDELDAIVDRRRVVGG